MTNDAVRDSGLGAIYQILRQAAFNIAMKDWEIRGAGDLFGRRAKWGL